jgi:hypothetical protein
MKHRPDRFWAHVERTETCWLWVRGKVNRGGYGVYSHRPAHQVAYELGVGPIPAGAFICHHCDVKLCVRPDHLYAGDALTNRHDAINRGRAVLPWIDHPPMLDPEVKARVVASLTGRALTPDHRARLSSVKTGRPHPNTHHPHTEASKAAIAAGQRRRWARERAQSLTP